MILNKDYYRALWKKFENIKILSDFADNTSCLSVKLILEHYCKNQPIHINFQGSKETMFEVGRHLFVELANDIYKNHFDLPTLRKGSKLRHKKKYADGKKHDYIVKSIGNGTFLLEDIKNKAQQDLRYDDIIKNFIPIEQGTKHSTLQGYTNFFSGLNDDLSLDFIPTNFEKKCVFIAKKPLWDCLPSRKKIPCTYLPNSREENDDSEIRSIPALQDCLIYVTPKYEVCYQNILSKGEKVKAIIIFDTEADRVAQILQDKARFDFNLIVISNSFLPVKNHNVPCWDWFREEMEILNSL